jgi:hypothetical protein
MIIADNRIAIQIIIAIIKQHGGLKSRAVIKNLIIAIMIIADNRIAIQNIIAIIKQHGGLKSRAVRKRILS